MTNALRALVLALGVVLYRTGLYRWVMYWSRRQPKILLYHACEHEESPFLRGLGSNTPPDRLSMHLAHLTRHYRILPLAALDGDSVPDRAVILTFDDGYRSVHDHAWPLLRARELPATVFLVTDVVDNHSMVWVNELNWFLHHHPEAARPKAARMFNHPPDSGPADLLEAARARARPEAIRSLLDELRDELGIDAGQFARTARLYLSWTQVEQMSEDGITFGNHTMTHPSVPNLTEEEQWAEIAGARDVLRGRTGSLGSFAFPFGDCDDSGRRAAIASGHSLVMEVGGTNPSIPERDRLRRIPVSGSTPAELFAEMELLPPIKAWMKRLLGREPSRAPR